MKFLTVVSQKNQALRLSLFLTHSEPGKIVLEKIHNSTGILYLDWGNSDAAMPEEIIELSKILGGAPTRRVRLPSATQVFTRLRYRDFKSIYRSLTVENSDLEEVFLLSYEGHYAVLARTLKDAGVLISLIEEGLGTYVHSFDNHRISVPNLLGTLYQAAKGLMGPILKKAPNYSLSALVQRFVREVYWGFVGERVARPQEIISGFREFDNFYTSFPDLGKSLFPNAKSKLTPFGLVMLNATKSTASPSPDEAPCSSDAIFLGQTYPLSIDALASVYREALNLTRGHLWLKPHPRITADGRNAMQEAAALVGGERIWFLDNQNSAELDIFQYRPDLVVSLTSSALTYAIQVHPGSSCVSLAPLVLKILKDSSSRTDRRTAKILEADFAVLSFFPHVETMARRAPK